MKRLSFIITALISLATLFYILYLTQSQQEGFETSHEFVDMTTDAMSSSRAQLSEIISLIQHIDNPGLPPEERKIWKCNKATGIIYQGAFDCLEANPSCMTQTVAKNMCRYTPLPSSYWNIKNNYIRNSEDEKIKRLENDIDRLNLRHSNIYIPPTQNTCKRGCSFISNPAPLGQSSYKLWKCNSHINDIHYTHKKAEDYYKTTDIETDDYNNEELCRNDIDCIWCNGVGLSPINTNTQAERERKGE